MKKRNETLWNTVRCTAEAVLSAEGTLPMHPAYGLADQTRLMALRDAAALGVVHAAKTHKVHPNVIYKWRKALLELVGH